MHVKILISLKGEFLKQIVRRLGGLFELIGACFMFSFAVAAFNHQSHPEISSVNYTDVKQQQPRQGLMIIIPIITPLFL